MKKNDKQIVSTSFWYKFCTYESIANFMGLYDLVQSGPLAPYRVHDAISDIFGVDVNDAQADKFLKLVPDLDRNFGQDRLVAFADRVCSYFVGRGVPWRKETRISEEGFWTSIKHKKDSVIAFINI